MRFTLTPLADALLVDPERHEDERGYFARSFCADEFWAQGLPTVFHQHNVSYNRLRGTIRGMHFQMAPHEEPKVVRCTRGAVHDAIIDLRRDSSTFKQWFGVGLTERNGRALYVPPGVAHGFQTLLDDTEVLYLMGARYAPDCARGVRWDDPAFGIRWPLEVTVISERDRDFPLFDG